MVQRTFIALAAACTFACSPAPEHGFAAYIVNQDAHAQATPGKSYSAEPCTLRSSGGRLELDCGPAGAPNSLRLSVELPAGKDLNAVLGSTMAGVSGEVYLPGRLALEHGSITVQTLSGEVARGNFNARVANQNPPWEVVGSFVARLK